MPKGRFSYEEPIPESQNSFEAQFEHKEKLRLAGGTAEVVDISPDAPKTEVPVLIAPGWGCGIETYKPAIKTMSEQSRRVISLNHPRIGGDMSKTPEEALHKYPKEQLRKAMNLIELLNQKGIEETDVIAHSESSINVAIAATLHPELFRNIVFFAPAGLIGKDTFTRLLQGFVGQATHGRPKSLSKIPITETEKQVAATAAKDALKYFAKNPIRATKEAKSIADEQSQIHEMLRYLHEKGIGIVVMSGVDDPVFPQDKIQKIAKKDMLDGYLTLIGGHGAIGEHPELHMAAAEEMLTALEEKKARATQSQPLPSVT